MTTIVPKERRTLGAFLALALVFLAVNVGSPARAAENVEPQGICEDTGWVRVGSWLGEYNSPWFYSGQYQNIQFKVLNGYTYKRTYRDCKTQYVHPGQAAKYRYYYYKPGKAHSYSSWRNVTRGCSTTKQDKLWGYNYGAGYCNSWWR